MIGAGKHEYIEWLLAECLKTETGSDAVVAIEAIDLLAERLTTPLQIEHYLTMAVVESFTIGANQVTTVEPV